MSFTKHYSCKRQAKAYEWNNENVKKALDEARELCYQANAMTIKKVSPNTKTKLAPIIASSNRSISEANIISACVACSAKNCWLPLVRCELRSLLHYLTLQGFLRHDHFCSFSLFSAHFKYFWKAELAGISSPFRWEWKALTAKGF